MRLVNVSISGKHLVATKAERVFNEFRRRNWPIDATWHSYRQRHDSTFCRLSISLAKISASIELSFDHFIELLNFMNDLNNFHMTGQGIGEVEHEDALAFYKFMIGEN
jgi:hypothetical protein